MHILIRIVDYWLHTLGWLILHRVGKHDSVWDMLACMDDVKDYFIDKKGERRMTRMTDVKFVLDLILTNQ